MASNFSGNFSLNATSNITDDETFVMDCDWCKVVGLNTTTYITYNAVTLLVLMPLIGLFGLFGNLTSAFIYTRPAMISSTNMYLSALAFSDFLVIITGMFLFSIDSLKKYSIPVEIFYGHLAPVFYPLGLTAQTCSVYFTVVAGVDCFVLLIARDPVKRVLCSVKAALLAILLTIIFSIAYNVPHVFEIEVISCLHLRENVSSLMVCPTDFRMNEQFVSIYYNWMYTIFMAGGPLVLLIVLNGIIVVVGTVQARKKRLLNPNGEEEPSDTVTLVLVVCLFIFCNSLALIINFLESSFQKQLGDTLNYLVDVSNLLVVCNSSANFIIYFAFGASFRRTLKWYVRMGMAKRGTFCESASQIFNHKSRDSSKTNSPKKCAKNNNYQCSEVWLKNNGDNSAATNLLPNQNRNDLVCNNQRNHKNTEKNRRNPEEKSLPINNQSITIDTGNQLITINNHCNHQTLLVKESSDYVNRFDVVSAHYFSNQSPNGNRKRDCQMKNGTVGSVPRLSSFEDLTDKIYC